MGSSRCSIVNVIFVLALFIMISDFFNADLCMITIEARGPIVHIPCYSDKQCQYRCRKPYCGCTFVCINNICQCKHLTSTYTNYFKPPYKAPPSFQSPPPEASPPPPYHYPPHQAPPPYQTPVPPPPYGITSFVSDTVHHFLTNVFLVLNKV
ncbi:hypothetical protein V8G54_026799 [Vigna mungo]|uniref:Uncharacterized protein n=1 Tax=Vigna mungo TaxID=3915 RepID=A0AAQ3N186_VIGMU